MYYQIIKIRDWKLEILFWVVRRPGKWVASRFDSGLTNPNLCQKKKIVLNQLQNWLGWSGYEFGQLGEDWHVFFRIHNNNNSFIIISNDNKLQSYYSCLPFHTNNKTNNKIFKKKKLNNI